MCYAQLAHAERRAIKWMADKEGVQDMGMHQISTIDYCSLCIEGTMMKNSIQSRTFIEATSAAVIRSNITAMNSPLIRRASYFFTLIDEASGHARAFYMKSKGEAAELLKHRASSVKRQSGWMHGKEKCVELRKRNRQGLEDSLDVRY